MDLYLYLHIRVLIFSIPGDFLGFLSRNCKGISDLYGFILYTFAISDRSVFLCSGFLELTLVSFKKLVIVFLRICRGRRYLIYCFIVYAFCGREFSFQNHMDLSPILSSC
ncbi:hypothetical protein ACB092_07G132900 [Castanea dentata]